MKLRTVVFDTVLGAGLAAGWMMYKDDAIAKVRSYLPREVVEVQVTRPEPELKDLVTAIPPRYGINPIVLAAIVERESGSRRDAIRYEPGQMDRARKLSKDPEQQRLLSSSLGYAQIMGWHAPRYGLSWADLLDPETNIETACAILKDCFDRNAGKGKVARLRGALTCYNGSTEYADAVIKRLGNLLIETTL